MRYLVEGNLHSTDKRVRVTAQLVEAEAGNIIWAARYDCGLGDIFALQDEITQAVTIAIVPAIADAERLRAIRKPPADLDAWGAYQYGLWHLGKFSIKDAALAERYFKRAIDLDETFDGGYSGLAWAQLNTANSFNATAPDGTGAGGAASLSGNLPRHCECRRTCMPRYGVA